jgi:hypothetical protein
VHVNPSLGFTTVELAARDSSGHGKKWSLRIDSKGRYESTYRSELEAFDGSHNSAGRLRHMDLEALRQVLVSSHFSELPSHVYVPYLTPDGPEYEVTLSLVGPGSHRVVFLGRGGEVRSHEEPLRFREVWRAFSSLVPGSVPSIP